MRSSPGSTSQPGCRAPLGSGHLDTGVSVVLVPMAVYIDVHRKTSETLGMVLCVQTR